MLRRNLDVSIGLVNGSIEAVTWFQWPMLARVQKNKGNLPEYILIKFDDPNIPQKYFDSIGKSVCIRPMLSKYFWKQIF